MTKLLYVKASPRGAESRSAILADAFLTAFLTKNPHATYDVLDLSKERLPEFDGTMAAAKMAVVTGAEQDEAEKVAWREIGAVSDLFVSADVYLFAVPMWNGGIPYKLKQLIDIVHQPGITFKLDRETGYRGLLEGKKAILALTSGAFGPDRPSPAFGTDHHSTYLKSWLNQAGVSDVAVVRFQPTLLTTDPDGDLASAIETAKALA